MTNSKSIAGLVGPTLIALSISEALNLRALTNDLGPHLVLLIYLNGTLLFVAGLSIVRAHNRWTGGWPVVLTLVGQFAILGGLIRMFAPVSSQLSGENTTAVYALLAVLLATGIFLTFKALGREESKSAVKAGRAG